MSGPICMHIGSMGPSQKVLPLPSTPWAGQFPSHSSLTTHRSPILILSRSSRPPGVHSHLRPGLDLPTSQIGLGRRFHPGNGGGLLIAAVITVIVMVIIFHAPQLPTSPPAREHPRSCVPTRVRGAAVRGPDRHRSQRGERGPASSRHSGLARGRTSRARAGEREGARQPPPTPRTHRGLRGGAPTSAGVPAAEARAGGEPRSPRSAAAPPPHVVRAGSRAWERHSLALAAWSGASISPTVGEAGASRMLVLWKKRSRLKGGLKAELSL